MGQKLRERLVSDLQVLSAAGVERAAWGWEQHASTESLHQAEREALAAIEKAERGDLWD